ncbi:MAG TPA: hypothetical protein VKT51_12280 [Candidatus Eremiobacteraceae bacterium]|nr:hypothetical protein [Candidatus Eremiobacteraceae bacterium]
MAWRFAEEGLQRNLTACERRILDALLSNSFPGSNELRQQLVDPGMSVTSLGEILRFDFHLPNTPRANVEFQVPVEATSHDVDGIQINFALHVVHGRLSELEIYRIDGSPMECEPGIEKMKEIVSPPYDQ